MGARMMKRCFFGVLLAVVGGIVPVRAQGQSAGAKMEPLVVGQVALGLDLLKSLRDEVAASPAVTLSPVSVHEAMWLVRLGADGPTAKELDSVLVPSGSAVALSERYSQLNDEIFQTQETASAELGNSLWVSRSIQIRDEYRRSVREGMRAHVQSVDFASPAVMGEINSFVSGVTHGVIPKLLSQPPAPSTLATLVNALYVKGRWVAPFEKESTQPQDFWVSKDRVQRRQMMHASEMVPYLEVPGWQVATLNFGMGQFSFSVLLPTKKIDGAEILSRLSPTLIAKHFKDSRHARLEISLPRMKVSSRPPLKPRLEARAPAAFSPRANFSRLSESPLLISDVIHESVVTIDEDGVEAAAASAVMMVGSAAPGKIKPRIIPFVVDHPFAFVISHRDSGAPLFMGIVSDPGV